MIYLKYDLEDERVQYLIQTDVALGKLIQHIGTSELAIEKDGFRCLVKYIIGQQISDKARETIWQRLCKLHYQMSSRYGDGHKNWGDTKGEDCYQDVCVMLNRTTAAKFKKGQLQTLPPATRNRLYVAITRAHGKCFFIIEK